MPNRSRYKSYAWTHPATKKLYARVQLRQPDGTWKTYLKPAKNKTHADQLAGEMLEDYKVRKTGFVEGESMTFEYLADWYKKIHSIPPVYAPDGSKISGIRTFEAERRRLDKLKEFFGKILIKNIDEDVLMRYKRKREKDKMAAATINRDLEILRAMFRKAVRRRWLRESPFDFGEKLIEKALEKKRDVVLTPEQEFALLETLKKSEKTLLYYAVLCLLDTGARPSEIYDASTAKAEPVLWRDFFDYDFKAVKLTSYKGRKKLVRFAPVTDRLELAMTELWNSLKIQNEDDQIFPVKSFKTAWGKARKKTDIYLKIAEEEKISIEKVFARDIEEEKFKRLFEKFEKENLTLDVRLRDLRRNFSTRLANAGMENDLRQRILGHEQAQTTFDYTQADLRTALAAKKMLDADVGSIIESDSSGN